MDATFFGRSTLHALNETEKKVWMYDVVTGGLLCVNLEHFAVEQFIEPCRIKNKQSDKIRGMLILHDGSLVLIPEHIWHDWILVDTKSEISVFFSPTKKKITIIEALCVDDTVYLIPLKSTETVAEFTVCESNSLEKLFQERGCMPFEKEENGFAFGAIKNSHRMFCPIARTRHIYRFEANQMKLLSIDIPEKIWGIEWDDGLWILPDEGNKLYFADDEGQLKAEIELFDDGTPCRASEFTRVITYGDGICLLPHTGSYIIQFDKKENTSKKIVLNDTEYWSLLDEAVNCSFWDYFRLNNEVFFLPYRYGFSRLAAENLLEKVVLTWSGEIPENKYCKCITEQKTEGFMVYEKGDSALQDFLRYI